MRTKKLNINKAMRTGVILAAIAIIALIALIMTFAKYAVQGTGEDSARVAKWGLNANIPTDLDLFDASYTTTGAADSSVTVDASDGSNVIAPGTSKSSNITLATFTNNEAPEVMYHFEPSLTITNSGSGQELIAKLDALQGWNWTLGRNNTGTNKYKTAETLINAVKGYRQTDIAPNTMPDTKTLQIGWEWTFESGYNASDTELGNLIAAGDLSSLAVTLNLNAYQCQGCKPIQKTFTVDSKSCTVNFLPAFTDGNAPGKFYKYDAATNGYTELDNSTMGKLAAAISTAGAENVYTTAKGTFYGTIDRTWNTTFKSDTPDETVSAGLDSTFASALDIAGVKTVYFANNSDTTPASTGNWNAPGGYGSKTEPDLGGVGYNSFYGAYGSLLSSTASYPWSSRAGNSYGAYYWYVDYSLWGSSLRYNYDGAVVLSQAF